MPFKSYCQASSSTTSEPVTVATEKWFIHQAPPKPTPLAVDSSSSEIPRERVSEEVVLGEVKFSKLISSSIIFMTVHTISWTSTFQKSRSGWISQPRGPESISVSLNRSSGIVKNLWQLYSGEWFNWRRTIVSCLAPSMSASVRRGKEQHGWNWIRTTDIGVGANNFADRRHLKMGWKLDGDGFNRLLNICGNKLCLKHWSIDVEQNERFCVIFSGFWGFVWGVVYKILLNMLNSLIKNTFLFYEVYEQEIRPFSILNRQQTSLTIW